jgi:mono/diheme cytochrome c family protein
MKIQYARQASVTCVLACVLVNSSAGQDKPAKTAHARSDSGSELFKQNCAVCHGNDGKGNGPPPSNSPFKVAPPDLTTLSKRHAGQFPSGYVADVLRSGVKMPDHGPAEMPVWGTVFKSSSPADEAEINTRIANLTAYLKAIQTK